MTLCARILKFEGEPAKACGEEATGGLRVVLLPAEAVEKRWGRSSLLTFVMDLPTCARCAALTSILDCTSQDLRISLGKMAQRINQGILVDWSRTRIEHVGFDHPEYILLRQAHEKKES